MKLWEVDEEDEEEDEEAGGRSGSVGRGASAAKDGL